MYNQQKLREQEQKKSKSLNVTRNFSGQLKPLIYNVMNTNEKDCYDLGFDNREQIEKTSKRI
jgi:hypothetical protein